MNTIKIRNKKFGPFISESEIKKTVARLAKEINRDLKDKKVVFVTHIDYGIESRNVLINEISEICNKYNLLYVNPSDKLDVLKKEMSDSNHYSSLGLKIIADYALKTDKWCIMFLLRFFTWHKKPPSY